MSFEQPTGPEKSKDEREFKILNEKEEAIEIMHLPNNIEDEFYIQKISDNERKFLPYKRLISGVVDHERGFVNWSDGLETVYSGEKDVVFTESEEKITGARKIIPEDNVMVGKVDQVNKTISFSQKTGNENLKNMGFIEEMKRLDDLKMTESLSKHEGDLYLDGLTTLSDSAAESLSKHKGTLYLSGLTTLSDDDAEFLSKQEGKIDLPPTAGGREK